MGKGWILKELARYNVGTYADIIYRNALLYRRKQPSNTVQRWSAFQNSIHESTG